MFLMSQHPNCILTYTGVCMDPTDPSAEQIRIGDIAHALSMMTRANGHFKSFYSVAQHSVNCCLEAEARGYAARVRLACLLHDASEAYLSDVTRPVKVQLPEYRRFEEQLQGLIYRVFGLGDLTDEDKLRVREIDDAFLRREFHVLFDGKVDDEGAPLLSVPDFSEQPFKAVEKRFLSLFRRLTDSADGGGKCLGIDGCRGGWICAVLEDGMLTVGRYAPIDAVFADHPDFAACLVDIPIGLRSRPSQRRPDDEARAFIRERGPTIFPAPCRQAVHAPTVAAAYEENERVLEKKLTPLTVGLLPKIRETDDFLKRRPEYANRLAESHPEVCFAALADRTLLTKKNTTEGQSERLALLRPFCAITQELVATKAAECRCAADDIVDAACLAVAAGFAAVGRYRTIPEKPETDDTGLLMRMVVPCIDI